MYRNLVSTARDHVIGGRIVKQLVDYGLLIDEYHGRNRVIKPSFKSYQILFVKDQGIETELIQ